MPKVAAYCLAWVNAREDYVLSEHDSGQILSVPPESAAWFAWLETVRSFTFCGQHGQLTVRQEERPRGRTYWYGYHRDGKKMRKSYLGRTSELTLAHLEDVAAELTEPRPSQEFSAHDLPVKAQLHQQDGTGDPFQCETAVVSIGSREITNGWHSPQFVTKVRFPRLRAQLVQRPHLIKRLQQSKDAALILISASAGFGKTTVLTQWLAESSTPVVWLSLDSEDNEPMRFCSSLINTLQQLDPQLGRTLLPLLEIPPQPTTLVHLLTRLANDISNNHPEDFALVLDDYHVITAAPIEQAMTFLVEHLPPQVHLILATRTDPSLPLPQLRARGLLCEVRTADLRFSVEESSTFLERVMGLALSPEHVVDLTRRTEGWIAGLQLAALSLRDRADVSSFLTAFTGSHRFVLDYLSQEVLSSQSESIQTFLLQTCFLERLTAPLCDAVTGREDCQFLLEQLERANLFVIPQDDERCWYRYHHLFAEMLQSRLKQLHPTLVPELHRRASLWYEQQCFRFEAVQSALAIPDVERAAHLIEQLPLVDVYRERIATALKWLSQLPDTLVRQSARLSLYHAVWLMFSRQIEAAADRLKEVEELLLSEKHACEQQTLWNQMTLARAILARFVGDLPLCIALSQEVLPRLSQKEPFWHPVARIHVAYSYLLSGDVRPATEQQLAEVALEAQSARNGLVYFMSIVSLAHVQRLQGRLRQAACTYEQIKHLIPGGTPAYFLGLGDLRREWHELEEAERLLSEMGERRRSIAGIQGTPQSFEVQARLKMAQRDGNAARAVLEEFKRLTQAQHPVPSVLASATALQAQLDLAQGNLEAAMRWAQECGLSLQDAELSYPREQEYLILARVCIAEGSLDPTTSPLQETRHLLDRLLQGAEANARMRSILEILIVQALMLHAQRDHKHALITLVRALTLAEPEGYIHLFIDEGEQMLYLLHEALTRGIHPDYVTTLLSAAGSPVPSSPSVQTRHAGALIEPLTAREREVLHLLAQGASNREIARHLVLSLGTVKKYVSTICSKLDVQSRTQAVARARMLHLLG